LVSTEITGWLDAAVGVDELRVPVRMAVAFAGLAVGLQAEFLRVQQLAHHRAADPVAPGDQGGRRLRQALAGPAQRRHRVAPLARLRSSAPSGLDQGQQIAKPRRILRHQQLAPAAETANPVGGLRVGRSQPLQATADRACRNARRRRHRSDAAVSGGACLGRGIQAALAFAQVRAQRHEALADQVRINHPNGGNKLFKQRKSRNGPIACHSIRIFPDEP
jgi:hypothetical protein